MRSAISVVISEVRTSEAGTLCWLMRGSRGVDRGVRSPPGKHIETTGFLSNTGLDPCKITKLHCLAKTRSDRDKLCHFWSKMKSQESQNKLFLSIASYLVHLILECFC